MNFFYFFHNGLAPFRSWLSLLLQVSVQRVKTISLPRPSHAVLFLPRLLVLLLRQWLDAVVEQVILAVGKHFWRLLVDYLLGVEVLQHHDP